jgi:hypothetical protein
VNQIKQMALVDCKECGEKVSTKASSCPHCGLPSEFFNASPLQVPQNVREQNRAEKSVVDDFGLSILNPVPCSSVGASYDYLESLITPDNQHIKHERLGPRLNKNQEYIDLYEISDSSGQFICEVFINAYAGYDTQKTPQGLKIEGKDSEKTNPQVSSKTIARKQHKVNLDKKRRPRPIEITETSTYFACKAIHGHLKPFLDDGWVCGNAVSLVDGWRNEYNLTKGSDSKKIEFDLRPSLMGISSDPYGGMAFTIGSMTLVRPQGMQKLRDNRINLGDRDAIADQSAYERYLLPIIGHIVVFGGIGGFIWFVYKCSGG